MSAERRRTPGMRVRRVARDERRAEVHLALPATIGVLADTHVFDGGSRLLSPAIDRLFARFGVDAIVHAGDVCTERLLERLAAVAPVFAVAGNVDPPDLWAALPTRLDLRVGGRHLVVVHGDRGPTALRTARALAGDADAVLFGHSHVPYVGQVGATVLFNPGSPTDRRGSAHFGVGIVRVAEAGIDPQLILFERPDDLDRVSPEDGRGAGDEGRGGSGLYSLGGAGGCGATDRGSA